MTATNANQGAKWHGTGPAATWLGWAVSVLVLVLVLEIFTTSESPPQQTSAPAKAASGEPLPACAGCNVLLVSIDTLRADHLGSYGYPLPTSPSLDVLAGRGVLFERAYSPSFVTADAHMSIFTSLFPSVHGVQNAVPDERVASRLSDGLSTLPEWLQQAGYATAAFTSGGNVSAAYGFDRGMDTYQVHADTTTGVERTLSFATERTREGTPFFVFLHTYETHDPYLPPAEIAKLFYEGYMGDVPRSREELLAREPDLRFAKQREAYWQPVDPQSESDRRQLIAAYDGEIRSVDEALQELWERLDGLGRTLVVVTSDHGEQFAEHGAFLHNDVYEELLRVPLIVVHPDGPRGQRVSIPVSTMDIAPTLMDVLGLTAPGQVQGRSLRPLAALSPRPLLSERRQGAQALIDQHDKLIVRPRRHASELYDLQRDPGEMRDRAGARGAVRRHLQGRLDDLRRENAALYARAARQGATEALDEVLAEQLRALGYGE